MEPQLNLIRSFPLKIFLIDLKAEEATMAHQRIAKEVRQVKLHRFINMTNDSYKKYQGKKNIT